MSDTPIEPAYIKAEGAEGRMGTRLMAIVADSARGRAYLAPLAEHEAIAQQARPQWKPETALPNDPRNFWTLAYGLTTFGDLFTPRQLVALSTFSDLVPEAIARIRADALAAGMPDDGKGLDAGGKGATAYAEAVTVYLAAVLSKQADWSNSQSSYIPAIEGLGHLFSKQSIPMVWDFIETNVFSNSAGNYLNHVDWVANAIATLPATPDSHAIQGDAQRQSITANKVVSTDPPYYDNIGYADLSDFFYVWLRRSLRLIFPGLYATLAVPKAEELIATPYRHGSKQAAEIFFLDGMSAAIHNLAQQAHPAFPVTIYYAFKQSDTKKEGGTHSTGWETFLEAVLRAESEMLAPSASVPMR
jgi:putative DNA methylase